MNIIAPTFAKKAKIIILDEVNCIISGLQPDTVEYFYKEYAIKTEYYFHTAAYQLGKWDGKVHFFSDIAKTYVFLLPEIIPKIEGFGYKMELDDRRTGKIVDVDLIDENYFSHVINKKTGEPWKLRSFQVESINAVLKDGQGIIIAGTGGGKTLIDACLCEVYARKGLRTITIVPSGSLVIKTKKDFADLELDVGEYSGDYKDLNHKHIISTWQALQNAMHVVKDFDVLIVDECHGARAEVMKKILTEHGNNIVYRFGLTATLPTGKADRFSVKVCLGEPKYEVPAYVLIDQGWLAKLNISIMQLDDEPHVLPLVDKGFKIDYDLEKDYISKIKPRLEWIAEFLREKSINKKGNVLCLVGNIPIGKKLTKLLPEAIFIYGKDNTKLREEVYDLFENNDNLLIIATVQIAGVGIDIDRIFNLVYIDGGKSFIRTIQSIGRGLRKGRDKDHVDVVDICGNLRYSREHLQKRIKYYKKAKYPYKKYSVEYREQNANL